MTNPSLNQGLTELGPAQLSLFIYLENSLQGKFINSAYWFNQMYYGSNLAFKRSITGRHLSFTSNLLTVKGFMEGNTYQAVLNISVMPRRFVTWSKIKIRLKSNCRRFHLAESIQRKLLLIPEASSSLPRSKTFLFLPSLPLLISMILYSIESMAIKTSYGLD